MNDNLTPNQRIFDKAIEVLGPDQAFKWYNTPNKALGDKRPLELLDTTKGTNKVLQLLGQIEHGVYS